ncbi:bifunctional phosphoribosyl-AMP cyclohydrolase/phosphoribosyl-ATP diphosphatase HisIE [Bacillus sp. SJS]|uniref:bifunctional phosphoribosyl-AMP cyclohydrolase/phosphoribosyl-ATP diphosphatase HisIE n=1 Tax=Bacillus sp. SJS TaxID=1423321 RepID=UPI0004DD5714|nr:bifunctional phosphoribosyl-AMP cyclohydrolase/phosphoribosyl-ATP diphosphatase HisIE [Bacillus sp. SJS]KZZ84882.1 bifunctional phosphoribosyl-AMP cyclohydrolase/phosphoribosyl-ATP pyrophosphatase [Bacillus sp. SJS]
MNTDDIRFDEKGLVPAIVQDAVSKEVLTLAYMNEESLKKTIESKETWFFSRSRNELWHKGATSGNTQSVVELRYDCDKDALLVLVEPKGPACHTGSFSCFEKAGGSQTQHNPFAILSDLERVIAERDTERPEGSYTTYLLTEGVDKILKKVGEEASEVIIAAKNRSHDELKWEAADLIFHLLVLLREQKLPFSEVLKALEERK